MNSENKELLFERAETEKISRISKKIAGLELSLEVSGQREAFEALKRTFANQVRLLGAAFLLSTTASSDSHKEHTTFDIASQQEVKNTLQERRTQPVTKEISEDGTVLYKHWDTNTTEIIDYFSGHGEVTDKMLSMCLRRDMSYRLEDLGMSLDEKKDREYLYSIDTHEELVKFYSAYFQTLPEKVRKNYSSAQEYAESMVTLMRDRENRVRQNFDPRLYKTLWTIFSEAGAPRIELVDKDAELIVGRQNSIGDSSYYSSFDEDGLPVIYLDAAYCTQKGIDVLLQEISHAKGFHSNPKAFKERLRREIDIEDRKYEELDSWYMDEAQLIDDESYDTKGTEEYHAHKVIFPKLFEQVEPLLKK